MAAQPGHQLRKFEHRHSRQAVNEAARGHGRDESTLDGLLMLYAGHPQASRAGTNKHATSCGPWRKLWHRLAYRKLRTQHQYQQVYGVQHAGILLCGSANVRQVQSHDQSVCVNHCPCGANTHTKCTHDPRQACNRVSVVTVCWVGAFKALRVAAFPFMGSWH